MLRTQEYKEEDLSYARTQLINSFTKEDHVRVRDRLLSLAAGAEPYEWECGICRDINEEVFHRFHRSARNPGYEYCGALFVLMGLQFTAPVAVGAHGGNKWDGQAGLARRQLCADMAVQISKLFLE